MLPNNKRQAVTWILTAIAAAAIFYYVVVPVVEFAARVI